MSKGVTVLVLKGVIILSGSVVIYCIYASTITNPMILFYQATQVKGSLANLMEEADGDGDGRISLPEFQKLLRSASKNSRTANFSSRSSSRRGFS